MKVCLLVGFALACASVANADCTSDQAACQAPIVAFSQANPVADVSAYCPYYATLKSCLLSTNCPDDAKQNSLASFQALDNTCSGNGAPIGGGGGDSTTEGSGGTPSEGGSGGASMPDFGPDCDLLKVTGCFNPLMSSITEMMHGSAGAMPDLSKVCGVMNNATECLQRIKCDVDKVFNTPTPEGPNPMAHFLSMCTPSTGSTGSCNQMQGMMCFVHFSGNHTSAEGSVDVQTMCPKVNTFKTCLQEQNCDLVDVKPPDSQEGMQEFLDNFKRMDTMCSEGCDSERFIVCTQMKMAAMVGGSGSLNGLSQEAQCELFPKGVAAFIECGEETKCSSLLKGSVSQLLQSAALECGPEAGKKSPPLESADFSLCTGELNLDGNDGTHCADFQKMVNCWLEKSPSTYGTAALASCEEKAQFCVGATPLKCPVPTPGIKEGPPAVVISPQMQEAINEASGEGDSGTQGGGDTGAQGGGDTGAQGGGDTGAQGEGGGGGEGKTKGGFQPENVTAGASSAMVTCVSVLTSLLVYIAVGY